MNTFQRLTLAAVALTLFVIVLGAYVRLSDAGLGCPDWPGCYGHLDVPIGAQQTQAANAAYPERPVEIDKAWKEMIHRYAAGILGLVILALAISAWRRRGEPGQPLLLPLALLGVVGFQALLGMWTVTWQLKPLVVTAHLLGGMTTLALLWWLWLRSGSRRPASDRGDGGAAAALRPLRPWALLGLLLLTCQIALGGWTSTNYAALACTDFPTCQASWWPNMDFDEAFVLWRGLGVNYEFGVLDHPARVAVHVTHRLGALVVFLYISALLWVVWRRSGSARSLRPIAATVAVLLIAQIVLGVSNVWFSLPLTVAVAHNGTAALLLLATITLNVRLAAITSATLTQTSVENRHHEHANAAHSPSAMA